MPMVQGPPLRFWWFVTEAAEQMEVPMLESLALVESGRLLQPAVTIEHVRSVIQAFPLGTVYSDLVLDNLTDTILKSKGGWHPDSLPYHQLDDSEHTSEIEFYQILKGCVDAVLWKREGEAENVRREAEKGVEARLKREAELEAACVVAAAAAATPLLPVYAKVVDGNARESTKEAPKQKKRLFRRR